MRERTTHLADNSPIRLVKLGRVWQRCWLVAGMVDLLPVRTGKPGRPFSDARRWRRESFTATGAGSRGGMCLRCSGAWQTTWTWHRRLAAQGVWDAVLARPLATRGRGRARSTGRSRWIPRSPAPTSAPPPSPATQGAGSNYTKPGIEPPDHQDPPAGRRPRPRLGHPAHRPVGRGLADVRTAHGPPAGPPAGRRPTPAPDPISCAATRPTPPAPFANTCAAAEFARSSPNPPTRSGAANAAVLAADAHPPSAPTTTAAATSSNASTNSPPATAPPRCARRSAPRGCPAPGPGRCAPRRPGRRCSRRGRVPPARRSGPPGRGPR